MSQIWLYIFYFFLCIDLSLTYIARQRFLSIKNVYYEFNLKYGYFKITLLKVGLALFQSWVILDSGLNNGRIMLAMIFYYLLIVKLSIDFLVALRKKSAS
jgi:hypothetical protein